MDFLKSTTTHLRPRFVLPPSMYVQGAKLSAKLIAAIVLCIVIAILLSVCTCYCCYKRHKSKARARRLAKEAAENKQLKPRINKRNARFFGPGMEDIELGKMEVEKPERTWVRVGKGMGGVMRFGN